MNNISKVFASHFVFFALITSYSSSIGQAATPDWYCKGPQGERKGNSGKACGMGSGQTEKEALDKAFEYSQKEFAKLCDASPECKNRKVSATPERTFCEVTGKAYGCYRLVTYAVEAQNPIASSSPSPNTPSDLFFESVDSNRLTKVAFLDVSKIIHNSKEGMDAKKKLEAAFNQAKSKLQSEESALKASVDSYKRDQSTMSETNKADTTRQIEARTKAISGHVLASTNEIKALESNLLNPILIRIKKIVGDLAKKRGYKAVRNSEKFATGDDITAEVSRLFETNTTGK